MTASCLSFTGHSEEKNPHMKGANIMNGYQNNCRIRAPLMAAIGHLSPMIVIENIGRQRLPMPRRRRTLVINMLFYLETGGGGGIRGKKKNSPPPPFLARFFLLFLF